MDNRSKIFLGVAAALAGGLAVYAVYFDYKRRNDVEFRKQLRELSWRSWWHAASFEPMCL